MTRSALLTLIAIAAPFLLQAADEPLLNALRAGDRTAVSGLLAKGADPNVKDESGASALMYAALYASGEEMRQLVDRGADVNAANANGSTALMWSAGDAARTRLLLDRGAAAGAKTKNGTTALTVATREGNAEVMRLLLARGADVKEDARALFVAAYSRPEQEVRDILAGAGLDLKDAAQLSAQLATAQNMIDLGLTARLLRAGAVPMQDVRVATFSASVLGVAASATGVDTVRTLLDRGADPNQRGVRGVTPLMMAVAAGHADPTVVQALLDKGADARLQDESGRTALDWALLQGETPAARVLRGAGGVALAPPVPAPPAPVARPRAGREAVERALARLQPVSPTFHERTKCLSCHHQSLPSMASSLAAARGARIDPVLARHPDEATFNVWTPAREEVLLGRGAVAGFVGNIGYGLLALAEEGVAPNLVTDAVALRLAAMQLPDGSWNIGDIRPPLFDSSAIHYTALSIRALDVYMPKGRRAETTTRIARGLAWLRAATPAHTQDEAFKLLGLVWAKAPAAEISRQAARLRALQRPDGGWAQQPTMMPDAYQTGQTLYALHASGMPASDPVYGRGARYLLRTQLEDGTWFVRSRAFGFQPYFETGFPHGTNQFISAAGTAWAAIALAYTL